MLFLEQFLRPLRTELFPVRQIARQEQCWERHEAPDDCVVPVA